MTGAETGAAHAADGERERGTVLVTGCNGRIGTAVMARLSERFADVVGLDRRAPTPPPPRCTRIAADLGDHASVETALDTLRTHHGTEIAAVVHLAAYYDFLGQPSPLYDAITVEGTRRVLRGLRSRCTVRQFIFSSTMLVHRPAEPGEFINEDWPLGATWAYPESKVRTEALLRAEHDDVPLVMLRLAGVYDDECHSPPLAHQMQRIYERRLAARLYSGETSHGQAYVHLADVVDAIERTVERRERLPPEVAVLIAEAETLSYDELQHTFQRLLLGSSEETVTVPGPFAKLGAWLQNRLPWGDAFVRPWMIDRANDHYAVDIGRARRLLEWNPRHALRTTLPVMVGALEADPAAWYREHGLEPGRALRRRFAAAAARAAAPARRHRCPHHADVVRDAAGECPRCTTPLEPA